MKITQKTGVHRGFEGACKDLGEEEEEKEMQKNLIINKK